MKENPGVLYDKYIFIQVFKEVWLKSAKVEYAIKGFEESGIYLMNPEVIKKVNIPQQKSIITRAIAINSE